MDNPTTGELNRRVLIRRWQDQPNAAFGIDPVYDPGVTVWGKLVPVGNAVYYGAKQTGDSITHRCVIRYRAGITGEHVVESSGVRYRVKRADSLGWERRYTVMELEELGPV